MVKGLTTNRAVAIPRCMKPSNFGTIVSAELHIFSDASSLGYGVAAYIVVNDGKTAHSSLFIGKSRLAPLKIVTIPHLELAASTVSVKIAQQIIQETETKINSVMYYTDSTYYTDSKCYISSTVTPDDFPSSLQTE